MYLPDYTRGVFARYILNPPLHRVFFSKSHVDKVIGGIATAIFTVLSLGYYVLYAIYYYKRITEVATENLNEAVDKKQLSHIHQILARHPQLALAATSSSSQQVLYVYSAVASCDLALTQKLLDIYPNLWHDAFKQALFDCQEEVVEALKRYDERKDKVGSPTFSRLDALDVDEEVLGLLITHSRAVLEPFVQTAADPRSILEVQRDCVTLVRRMLRHRSGKEIQIPLETNRANLELHLVNALKLWSKSPAFSKGLADPLTLYGARLTDETLMSLEEEAQKYYKSLIH